MGSQKRNVKLSQEQFEHGQYKLSKLLIGEMYKPKLPEITAVKVKVAYLSSKKHNQSSVMKKHLRNVSRSRAGVNRWSYKVT